MVSMEHVPPSPDLFESMRSVGYDLVTALSDIVDNSIAASAKHVWIDFAADPKAFICVTDDGMGMSKDTVKTAMTLAGRGPSSSRSDSDLGRFGLGLKTASLSQARCFSVISSQAGEINGATWDLDVVKKQQQWSLQVCDGEEAARLLPAEIDFPVHHGTSVLWRNLDQIKTAYGLGRAELDVAMADCMDWLGFVFHRFLESGGLSIFINKKKVEPKDPFLEGNRRSHRSPTQSFRGPHDASVQVTAVALPHVNTLSRAQRSKLFEKEGQKLRETQGFYIYRAQRLITWGTWFNIVPKSEQTKLVRIAVEIPTTLDDQWALDIKKARVYPPKWLKDELRRFVPAMSKPGQRTITYRGRRSTENDEGLLWNEIEDRGAFRYEVNLDHPLVHQAMERMGQYDQDSVRDLLSMCALAFPVERAVLRINGDQKMQSASDREDSRKLVESQAYKYWDALRSLHWDKETFVDSMLSIEPFTLYSGSEQILREVVNTDV